MGKIIPIPMSDKRLIFGICKEVSQINHGKKTSQKWSKNVNIHFILEDTPRAKTYIENV